MKKLLVITAALCVSAITYSQQADRTSFGLRAGVNFQNINGKDDNGDKWENKLLVGFNIGVNAEIPVAPEFYLQPGVLLSTKGAKAEDSDFKTKLSYIEIPVNFLYKPVLGTGRLLLGVGPYMGFAIGGKITDGDNDVDIKFEKEVTLDEYQDGAYAKRFDAGANMLVGYEFTSRFSAQLNAQLGLVNIKPDITGFDDDATLKNTGFGVSLGYRF
jgi:hypothetical protein